MFQRLSTRRIPACNLVGLVVSNQSDPSLVVVRFHKLRYLSARPTLNEYLVATSKLCNKVVDQTLNRHYYWQIISFAFIHLYWQQL